MIRTTLVAGIAFTALCALPASAQLGLGGGGQVQVPGASIGGAGQATVDTRPATDTVRDAAGHTKATAQATADAAKQKAAEAAARAKAAKPDVQAGASTSTLAGVGVSPQGASASASSNTSVSGSVQPHR